MTYGYNAGGLRVWSQVSGGSKTFYIFSGSTLLGEVQNGIPAVAYTWGASGLVSERLLSANKSLWYCFGPQGETRQLTDSAGAVADTYLYSPYGTLRFLSFSLYPRCSLMLTHNSTSIPAPTTRLNTRDTVPMKSDDAE